MAGVAPNVRSGAFAMNGPHGFDHGQGRHGGVGFGRGVFGAGLGYGLYDYGPYAYYGDDYYDYPAYSYDDTYGDNGGCYLVRQRVHTRSGWRFRPVQVCG
jgi:hypothetical protein